MKLPRRRFLHLAAGVAALPVVSRTAWAQAYPSRPVKIIVPFAPAGSTDIVARLMGQWLSERLGQQFVVENRPGAGTNIGTEAVVTAPADGYTLLLAGPANVISMTLYDKLNFNFTRDIAPIASIMRFPFVMEVHPSVPAKTVPEFMAYAKATPGKLNMASAGTGSATHLTGELFKMMTGLNILHVPYRGAGPALIDMIGGQVQLMFDTVVGSIEHIRGGRLRALAVTGAARSDVLPDIPTVGDFVPGYGIAHVLYDKLNFNLIRDTAPVAGISNGPLVMEVNPTVPAQTVPEFIAYAKANPGKINFASPGNGSTIHLCGELFKMMTGVNMVHVPYRGNAPALTDLLAGQVQMMFADTPSSIEHLKAGKMRALAVTTAMRSDVLPEIPTVSEFIPGFEASNWFGVAAPKNTPLEIIDKLNKEINVALAEPKIKARLADLGAAALAGSPADFGKLISEEAEKWGKVIRAANIKPEG